MSEKKQKALKGIAFFLIPVIVSVCLLYYFLPKYYVSDAAYKNGRWFNEKNIIFDGSRNRIREGMHYEQVVRQIGRPNRQIGSGNLIMEYDCRSGAVLRIYIICDLDSETNTYGPWKVETVTYIKKNT